MEVTEIYYPKERGDWRRWLQKHHSSKSEIWVRRYRKATGKPCITYDELVEESLCFGWIDGIIKKLDDESSGQRITPRRKKSYLSELNRQRVWRLQRLGLMTPAGIAPIEDQIGSPDDPFEAPAWMLEQLQADKSVWKQFQSFSSFYQRLKIGWIGELPESRRTEAQRRLDYLMKKTRKGERYGTEPLAEFEQD